MELYNRTAQLIAETITKEYSSSFSTASTLFANEIKGDIYAIYGLVRIADEIVDTYTGADRAKLLSDLETETYEAIKRGYSTNPIIHAFALTAKSFHIARPLIHPFFESMRMDLAPKTYNAASLAKYIYGSAEVVGLMCLKVFCADDAKKYNELKNGAQRLGAGYQKVNFLRDLSDDHHQLGRFYFVGTSYEQFDEKAKETIVAEINRDFEAAEPYIAALPDSAKAAVSLSARYYRALLDKLEATSVETIKRERIRLSKAKKLSLYLSFRLGINR